MTVNQGFTSIQEFSDVITEKWQINFDQALAAADSLIGDLYEIVDTPGTGAHISFINGVQAQLEELGDTEGLTYQTISATTVTENWVRKGKGLMISRSKWNNPTSQRLFQKQLDSLVQLVGYSRFQRIVEIFNNGETIPSYDTGQAIFSTTHSLNGITFSNLLANNPLTPEGFNAARAVIQSVPLGPSADGQGFAGLPATEMQLELKVFAPSALQLTLETLLNQGLLPAGSYANTVGNVLKDAAKYVITDMLTDPNDWIMVATMTAVKPFAVVRQESSSSALVPLIADDNEMVASNNVYRWALNMFEQLYMIHWYLAVKSTAANS
jgi:hypothetical protein